LEKAGGAATRENKNNDQEDRHFTAHYDRLSTQEAAGFSREKEHEQHSKGTCTCEANASSGASNLDCRDRRALPKIDDGAVNSVNLLFIFACGVCVTKNRSSIFGGHVPDFGMNHEQNHSFVEKRAMLRKPWRRGDVGSRCVCGCGLWEVVCAGVRGWFLIVRCLHHVVCRSEPARCCMPHVYRRFSHVPNTGSLGLFACVHAFSHMCLTGHCTTMCVCALQRSASLARLLKEPLAGSVVRRPALLYAVTLSCLCAPWCLMQS